MRAERKLWGMCSAHAAQIFRMEVTGMNAEQDKVQWIYGQLCDEESRYLFENRRKYAESGEWKYIENIVRSIPQYADNVYYGGKEQA